jgi:hypothetical protein
MTTDQLFPWKSIAFSVSLTLLQHRKKMNYQPVMYKFETDQEMKTAMKQ